MRNIPFVIDADVFSVSDENLSIIYENDFVKDFLESTTSSCVSSAKGFGKTFLLKVKRKRMQEEQSIVCIPQNRMLDVILDIAFNRRLINKLRDYHTWVKLWELSISLSIIKYECNNSDYMEIINDELDINILKIINSKLYNSPCEILSYILSLEQKTIGIIIKNVSNVMAALSLINHAYAIFIDSIDERIKVCIYDSKESMSAHGYTDNIIWYYAQYSILESIIGLRKINKHIKIYCSIRQEAIQNHDLYPTELHQQISEMIYELKYTYIDLKNMFKLYINCIDDSFLLYPDYKDKDINYAFFGHKSVLNIYNHNNEDTFHYIYRHSLKRPRDIMDICLAISTKNASLKENIDNFKILVNDKAKQIAQDYILTIDRFMGDLNFKELIAFFNQLNSNIFRKSELRNICSSYNQKFCYTNQCANCDETHPFCELYNIGLLGYAKTELSTGQKMQFFLSPGNSYYTKKTTLPQSELYFLHPSINDWIKDIRLKQHLRHNFCKSFIIGDSKPITNNEIRDAINEIKLNRTIFLSSTNYDNADLRPEIYDFIKNEVGIKNILSYEMNDFPIDKALHSHDNCIKNVELCDMFVIIIGSRYGGNYSGTLYKNELLNQYNYNVSILWAEYWKAFSLKKDILVFLREKVSNELSLYKFNKKEGVDMTLRTEYDNADGLLKFIDTLQHQNQGSNWRYLYKDSKHLKELLMDILILNNRDDNNVLSLLDIPLSEM